MFALVAAASPLGAQTQQDVDEARRQRDDVRAEADEVAAGINALTDEADDLATQLDLLDVKISALDSRLAAATSAAESAGRDLDLVNEEIAQLEGAQAELQAGLVESLVDHYIEGHAVEQGSVLTAQDPTGWAMRKGLVSLVTRDVTTVQDQLRVIADQLESAKERAADLARAAADERDEVERLGVETVAAHETQAGVLAKVSRRLDRRLAEAEALARLDAELSDEIRRGEEEIARRVAAVRAKRDLEQADGGGDSGGGSVGAGDHITRAGDVVNVRGIEVHHSIAENLRGLMNAAEGAGIILGGAGWRSTEYQIQLRMQNCGTTDYLIFEAPSEACWPPTAKPASSNHEAGLAVDFTANGWPIIDQNSIAFQWLAANAASYGFYNLWSEPWHWSTDGR